MPAWAREQRHFHDAELAAVAAQYFPGLDGDAVCEARWYAVDVFAG